MSAIKKITSTIANTLLRIAAAWLFTIASNIAFSSGALAPELQVLNEARNSPEYPKLKQIQDLVLDLQMIEIQLKNRRDTKTELRITMALSAVEEEGAEIRRQMRRLHDQQTEILNEMRSKTQRLGFALPIKPAAWDQISVDNGHMKVVTNRGKTLVLLDLTPITLGRDSVLIVKYPMDSGSDFWKFARRKLGADAPNAFTKESVERFISRINALSEQGATLRDLYQARSYQKLYTAFDTQRFAIFQRITMAKKLLAELSRTNSAMNAPHEYAEIYNRALETLYGFGIDVSLTTAQRDFTVKGFLFGKTPQEAAALFEKMRFSANENSAAGFTFNSPSS